MRCIFFVEYLLMFSSGTKIIKIDRETREYINTTLLTSRRFNPLTMRTCRRLCTNECVQEMVKYF